jgi:Protein of unknown function (DUF2796)
MTLPSIHGRTASIAILMLALSHGAMAQSHQHAHVHGHIQLGVAVDGKHISVDIDTPLESLLGFEHAPRTSGEKKLAAEWAQRLREGGSLLRFNPEAQCKLIQTDLDAPVLGLGNKPTSPSHHKDDGGHADLEGTWSFECSAPEALRSLELSFFKHSPHAQVMQVQWVKGNKQGKQTLKRPQSRINLAP